MSGPRISTGTDSKQDYGTPADFLAAVEGRFGPIVIDLAAHAGNHKHARYFAPAMFVEKVERGKTDLNALVRDLLDRGAMLEEANRLAFEQWACITGKGEIRIPNRDLNALAFDAFSQDWAAATTRGLGFLNCEFSDVEPWAKKCGQGGNVGLLTPASVGANWARDRIFGKADVYILSGRLCFDGKNVFPKDCMFSHFHENAMGAIAMWDWRKDAVLRRWAPCGTGKHEKAEAAAQRGLFE